MSLAGWESAPVIKGFTIPDQGELLTDFVVMLKISGSSGTGDADLTPIIEEVGDNWQKIAVELGQTGTQCYVEQTLWDSSVKIGVLRVKIPACGAGETTCYLYADNTQADNVTYVGAVGSTAGQNVVAPGDVGVYRQSTVPAGAGSVLDSSPAANHGTPYNMGAANLVDGYLGKGWDYNGTNEYCAINGVCNDIAGGDFDVSLFFKMPGDLTANTLLSLHDSGGNNRHIVWCYYGDNRISFNFYNSSLISVYYTPNFLDNSYHTLQYSYSRAANKLLVYIDGIFVTELILSATWDVVPSNGRASIGQEWDGGTPGDYGKFVLDELVLSTSVKSAAWRMAWHLSVTDNLVTWDIAVTLYLEHSQLINTLLSIQQNQLIATAPRLYHQLTQILATARRLNLGHDQVFDSAIPLHLQQEQVFNNLAQVALLTTQVMRNYGASVALEMLQTWAAYDYNLVYLPIVQLIGAQLGTVLQEIQFSVTVAASRVGVVDCNFNRKGFCNVASLLLRNRQEWVNKAVGDPVVLTVLGEQYEMIVVNKPQDEQVTQGTYEVGYLLECASVTCQLAEGINPDLTASRVTGSFPAGTMLTEILDFLTDGVCSYNLAVPDFPTGGYDFDDAERFAALREVLPEQYGWVIKTDKAGLLHLSQWRKPETGGAGQKTLTMSRKSLTPPADTIYTQVVVRNYSQQDGTSGLRLEVVDNGDGTGTIYGYSVPWIDAFSVFDSEDSPAPSLLITGGTVEEVEVEDTDVEFVNGQASLSKPCYSAPVIDWGNNDSLSPITSTESGTLTTATEPGYSVAVKVTYLTRRKVWTFDNRKIDVSQVRLKYV